MFKLVFNGELQSGAKQARVVAALAKLLKTDADKIQAKLFAGKSVTLKRVASHAEALKWQRAFAKAGAVLAIVEQEPASEVTSQQAVAQPPTAEDNRASEPEQPDTSAHEAAAAGPNRAQPKSRKRLYIGLGILAQLIIAAIVIALWYARPLWQPAALSDSQQALGSAMVTDESFAIARLDVQRLNALEGLSGDEFDLQALPVGEGVVNSLARSGLNIRADVDTVWLAGYLINDKPASILLATGRFDSARLTTWFSERYEVDQTLSDGVVFRPVDETNCEKGEPVRAFVSDNLVLLGDVEQVGEVLERMAQQTAASDRVARWFAVSDSQLASAAVFAPENIGHTLSGLPGMMLGGMGRAAAPADGLYFGVEPVVLPPGVELQVVIESDDSEFIQKTDTALTTKLQTLRASAEINYPETVKLYDRLSVSRTDAGVQAAMRFDQHLRTELSTWFTSLFAGAISSNDDSAPVSEQLDENPPVFGSASPAPTTLAPSSPAYSDPFFQFSSNAGPFALGVQTLELSDANTIAIGLEARAYDLPNLASRGVAAHMVLTDIINRAGDSIMPPLECGQADNREPVEIGQVMTYNHYVDGESLSGRYVSGKASYTLPASMDVNDIGQLQGYIDYPAVTSVETITLNQPLAGQTIERDGFSLRFTQAGPNAVSYLYQGEPGRLLHVAGLNAQGQALASGGAMWGGVMFGSGQTANVDFQGEVAAVKVVLAKGLRPQRFDFTLQQVVPGFQSDSGFSHQREPIQWTPESWTDVFSGEPPAVSYRWNKPVLEQAVGPMTLAVYDASANEHFGVQFNAELFVDYNLALTGLLSPGRLVVESVAAPLSDETIESPNIETPLSAPLSFALDGGMWVNGVYQKDDEKNWVKARVDLRERALKLASLGAMSGYVELNLPLASVTEQVPFTLGQQWRRDDLTLTVSKIEAGAAYLSFDGNLSPLISVQGKKEGESVTESAELHSMFGDASVKLTLTELPDELVITVATQSKPQRFDFELSLPTK
ncbi:hypothetical protein KO507_14435 [Gilvimarinus agarilyticus]|uniref:hypothetical protein n=1 Tax=Gilvimarinus sp. 2_MG-2023 TaxID=3062666 RepID=UPI001C094F54|nr:hypothetical protein [Gilvimarinus sp. 2_MG-2023]MBU2886964.1 hypothetical protein [Gilvimarinus agarilyticus]MDO6571624.1 hypothetical protein [Gilvimarinus sp. 2_MG-2023]